jgi:thiamine biosynthesis protein ThiS
MTVTINGESREVPDGVTVGAFLEERGIRPRMVVVEHNGEILARERYAMTAIAEGDTLEIVQMMAGG